MQKVKLSKSQAMLASIATTERDQVVQQANGIYLTRMQCILDELNVKQEQQPRIEAEGQDLYLAWNDYVPPPDVQP